MTGRFVFRIEVLLLALVALFLGMDGPAVVRPLIVEQARILGTPDLPIHPETGHAFVVNLASLRPAPLPELLDDSGRANLELLEGARPLRLQTARSSVRRNAGAYVWADDALYFSASDGTDPRANGRPYRIVFRAALPTPPKSFAERLFFPAAITLLVLSWAIAGLMAGRGLADGTRSPRAIAVFAVVVASALLFRHWSEMPQALLPWALVLVSYGGLSAAVPAPLAAALALVTARLGEIPYLANWCMALLACLGATSLLARLRSRAPREAPFARALSVLWLLPAAILASATARWPALSLTSLAAGVAVTLLIRHASRRELSRQAGEAPSPRLLWAACALVFLVALGTSVLALRSLSTPIAPDSIGYWSTWAGFWRRSPGLVPIRTPLYELLFAVFEGTGLPGIALIGLQSTVRALACAAVAFYLARESVAAATFVGLLLAIDPVGAAASVQYLSESLCTSGLVLATTVTLTLVRSDRSRWTLLVSGLVIGFGALFRPGGAALMAMAVALLAVTTRSLRRSLLPATGAASVALAIVLRNVLRSGVVTLAATGLYLAFPLFIQHLFSPGNGPVSVVMDGRLRQCMPTLDYASIVTDNSNQFVRVDASQCLLPFVGGDQERLYAMYHAAYLEAIRARPIFFVRQMALESARFLGKTASYYPGQVRQFALLTDFERLCRNLPPYDTYQPDLIRFVCPMPAPRSAFGERVPSICFITRWLYQPYLAPYSSNVIFTQWADVSFIELAGVAGLLFFTFVAAYVPRAYRPLVITSAVVIVYHAVTTALGQVTLLRYVAMMSPFLLVISGLMVATAVGDVVGLFGRRRLRPIHT